MKRFLKSFVYAFRGITYCILHERNMRVHLCFALYMFGFLTVHDFFEVSRTQFAILFIACAVVMALEAVNTAVEKSVDLQTKEMKPLAKISKDAAAGAVLVFAIFSVLVGIVIMLQKEAFEQLLNHYVTEPIYILYLVLSLIVALLFIFKFDKLVKVKKK